MTGPVHQVIEAALADRLFPGVAVSAIRGGEAVGRWCAGVLGYEDHGGPWAPVDERSVYDLASLTKPLAGAMVAAILSEQGRLRLDQEAAEFLPELAEAGDAHARITVREILAHSAGYPAWRPYYEERGRSREDILAAATCETLEFPPGKQAVYSDVGYLALTLLLERAGGDRLDKLFRRWVTGPLGVEELFFLPTDETGAPPVPRERVAPTAESPERGRLLWGEVDDENCAAVDGVAAHAGLFGSLRGVEEMFLQIREIAFGEHLVIGPATLAEFWTRQPNPADTTWCLGWDTPNAMDAATPSSVGPRFSRDAVGMLGFTGTSLWYDRSGDLAVIALSNRVHPDRNRTSLKEFRPALHTAVLDELG